MTADAIDPDKIAEHVRTLRAEADQATERATLATNEAARALVAAGFTLRDVGELLGISHTRVRQIINAQE